MEKISSDVLVIGNGAAGLRAAIASREAGADVLVISKSPPGLGTCTLLSGGALGAALGGLSQEAHRAITLDSGRGVNQPDLVEAFVSEAPSRLQELAAWGMKMSISPGYAMARGAAPAFGRELIRTLLDRARRTGVRFLSPLAAHTLVVDGSRGVWTLAYEFKKGLWIGFASKAVVLASGGCGALYPRHDNPQRITGDGYALALKAGAKLRDMEFVQFYALGAAEPGRPPFLVLPGVADFGVLTNDQGEDLLEKYDIRERPAAAMARDRLAQVLFHEIQDKGQRVYLDLTRANVKDVSYDYISSANWSYLEGAFRTKECPLRVAPLAHFMMGGVCITPGCDTAIPGVFAAGEVVGGLHGANRLGGNALSECIVFGARAGVSAASWAGKSKASVDGNRLAKLQALIPEFSLNPGLPSPIRPFKQTLRQILWEHGGIFREREGLTEGLRRLAELREEVMALHSGTSPLEVSRLLDLRQGILTARAILESALRREETRGAHCRTDFPLQDEKWKGSQIVSLSEENLLQFDFAPLHK
jgi:succinate dehydrogenase/fumarate reductase flavoprotein subunit